MLGVSVDTCELPQVLRRIDAWVNQPAGRYVCLCNVHSVMTSNRNIRFRDAMKRADLVLPDGKPVAWGARMLGYEVRSNIRGPDLVLALCHAGLGNGYSHFFYGGKPGVADELARRLSARYPGLKVAGVYAPPFRPLSPEEDAAVVKMINGSGANILWVGLGAPKQEVWMAEHVGKVAVPVMIGVGAAFDFHSGSVAEAPVFMRQIGLEWLFRLWQEPRRLGRRYLVDNSLFVIAFTRQWMSAKATRYRPH